MRFVEYLSEAIWSEDDDVAPFKKLSDSELEARKPLQSFKSERFDVHIRPSPAGRLITVHHNGEHVGSMTCGVFAKDMYRVNEMTKDQKSDTKGMMPEVMSHMRKHGVRFLSSNTLTKAGHKVWEQLKSGGDQIHLVKAQPQVKYKSLEKDISPSSTHMSKIKDPTHKSDKVQQEYMLEDGEAVSAFLHSACKSLGIEDPPRIKYKHSKGKEKSAYSAKSNTIDLYNVDDEPLHTIIRLISKELSILRRERQHHLAKKELKKELKADNKNEKELNRHDD